MNKKKHKMLKLVLIFFWVILLTAMCYSNDVERLIQQLKEGDPSVREKAASALGKIGDKKCIPLIAALLPDWDNNYEIIKALEQLDWMPESEIEQVYLWFVKGIKKNWLATGNKQREFYLMM